MEDPQQSLPFDLAESFKKLRPKKPVNSKPVRLKEDVSMVYEEIAAEQNVRYSGKVVDMALRHFAFQYFPEIAEKFDLKEIKEL